MHKACARHVQGARWALFAHVWLDRISWEPISWEFISWGSISWREVRRAKEVWIFAKAVLFIAVLYGKTLLFGPVNSIEVCCTSQTVGMGLFCATIGAVWRSKEMVFTNGKHAFVLVLLVVVAGAGCRVNLLPEYANKIEDAHIVNVAPGGPLVWVGNSPQPGAVGLVANALGAGAAHELTEKIEKETDPKELTLEMAQVFGEELNKSFSWKLNPDVKGDYDTRMEVRIDNYGFYAHSLEGEVYYNMQIEARMIYTPENKLIWEYDDSYSYPVKPVHIYSNNPVGDAVNTGINLAVLGSLKPEELRQVFLSMAQKAGGDLVQQIREDIVD